MFSRLDLASAKALEGALSAKLAEIAAAAGVETGWSSGVVSRGPKGTQRPEGTNSVFKVDADPETDPLAATMLRALIEQADTIEVDWGTRQSKEEVLEMLDEIESAALFEQEDAELDRAVQQMEEEEEGLFERVLEAVLAASSDLERGMELKEAIQEASPQARAWMEHVVRNNVRSDDAVDRALGLEPPASERIHREIEALLAELAE